MQPQQQAALGKVSILAGVSPSGLERLARTCKWKQHEAGEPILSYQERSTDVFFLAAGRVRVIIYSAEGRAVVFSDLEAGAIFGEMAAIDGKARSASIEALTPCTVASLTAAQFEALLLSEPAAALAVLRLVTANVRRLSERVFEFSTLVVQNRIQAELLRRAGEAGRGGDVLLAPAPSLSDIADRISTHREAVSRELSRLGSIGLLRRENGGLRITDVARLAALVREARGE